MPPFSVSSPWAMSPDEVLQALGSSAKGLSRAEAARRVEQMGPNELAGRAETSAWIILYRQFSSPLTLLLVAASGISFWLGERTETMMIVAMILAGGLLGFFQEYRSENALRKLGKKLSRHATVIRNGRPQRVDARLLVPGDIVELDIGTVVPADLRLIQLNDLEADESVITGESVPVPKSVHAVNVHVSLPQDQVSMVFAGTHIAQGSGLGVVTAIGRATEVGKTAALLATRDEETSFQAGVRQFGSFLFKLTIGMAVATAIILGGIHGQWGEALLFALALAVGIAPELLPVIITVNLSQGALRLSKQQVLVKKLTAIEDLGNADVFCTDKTGTLTVGRLRLRGSIDADGKEDSTPLAHALHCVETRSGAAMLNPMDQALADGAKTEGIAPFAPEAETIDVIAFDFQRRRAGCVLDAHGKRWIIVKGAVAEVMAACTHRSRGESSVTLTEPERKRITQLSSEAQERGERLLAVARREIATQDSYGPKDERDLELIGFVRVSDAPKETARAAIRQLADLQTRIVILTGDTEHVTRYIATQLDFAITGVVTGEELEAMDEAALTRAMATTNVFARITPVHKLRIIKAFRAAGHTVGYMGDGVNDAPALKAADVGISFDGAVDVAREAADVILLKKNLSVLADGIREGRRIFVNTRTYLYATISSNFGNMLSVAGAALLLPFIPLLPSQILLLNIITDLPMLAIGTDQASEDDVAHPLRWDNRVIARFMVTFGAISSIADYATFGVLYLITRTDMMLFRSTWFFESLFTELVIIFLVRSRHLMRAKRPSMPLIIFSIGAFIIGSICLLPPLNLAFGLTPLTPQLIGSVLGIIVLYAVGTFLAKLLTERLDDKRLTQAKHVSV
jgi:Mg2+-importing ATPase